MRDLLIPLPQPFAVDWALTCLRSSSFGTPYYATGPDQICRVLSVAEQSVLVQFAFDRSERHVSVTLLATQPQPQSVTDEEALWTELARLATHLLGLSDDLPACYATLGQDPVLAPLLQRFGGLRMLRAPGLYEALLSAILGQQISVASAQSIRRRLMAGLGERVSVNGEQYVAYPSPSRLLAAGYDGLLALGITRQKSRYLLEVAERAVGGVLERAQFADLTDDTAIARLREIPGVGRWTAEVALMYGLGRPDVLFAGDLALQTAVQRVRGLAQRPREGELRALGERWAGWRSYAALYLMMTLKPGT